MKVEDSNFQSRLQSIAQLCGLAGDDYASGKKEDALSCLDEAQGLLNNCVEYLESLEP